MFVCLFVCFFFFVGVRIVQILVICVVFYRSLLGFFLSLFFWPLQCLSFDLWLLTTALLFSNPSLFFLSFLLAIVFIVCPSLIHGF